MREDGREFPQREFAGQHLVKDHPERVDVSPTVHVWRFLDLLGCHVVRGADDLLGLGQRGRFGFAPQDFGDAEVHDLHPAPRIEENVFRFDVAVDDAFVVGELERLADLRDDQKRLARGEFACLLQLPQVQPLYVFHDEVRQALNLAELVHGDDVRMV